MVVVVVMSDVEVWLVFLTLLRTPTPVDLGSLSCKNCLNDKCSDTGKCTNGCKIGWADQYCRQPCQRQCLDSKCSLDGTGTITCDTGCIAGYCGSTCLRPCRSNCTSCNRKCNCIDNPMDGYNKTFSINSTKLTPCSKGLFGTNCTSKCAPNCQECTKDNGICESCFTKHFGDNCQYTCSQCIGAELYRFYATETDCKVCRNDENISFPEGLQIFLWTSLFVLLIVILVLLIVLIYPSCKNRTPTGHARNSGQAMPFTATPPGDSSVDDP